MGKSSKIKWRDEDKKELQRVVKNFNSKIERITKKDEFLAGFQPQKISYSQLLKEIETRQDFKRKLNELKMYTKKGMEQLYTDKESGLIITKYELERVKNLVRIINIKRAWDKKTGMFEDEKPYRMLTKEEQEKGYRPKKFSTKMDRKSWEMFVQSAEQQSSGAYNNWRLNLYKENYIKSIEKNLTLYKDEILKIVENMSPEELFLRTKGSELAKITFHYSPIEQAVKAFYIYQELGGKPDPKILDVLETEDINETE